MSFEPITKDELLALWRTLFPPGYTVPIETEAGGQGFDVPSSQAAIAARVAEAIAVTSQAYYLLPHSTQIRPPAGAEIHATGQVRLARAGNVAGSIDLDPGTEVVAIYRNAQGDEIEGERFALLNHVVWSAGDSTPQLVDIEASRPGYQGNVPEGTIARFALRGTASVEATAISANELQDNAEPDRFTQAMVGQFLRIDSGLNASLAPRKILAVNFDPSTGRSTAVVDGAALVFPEASPSSVVEFADIGLTVEQLVATSGGRHGWLDEIGAERLVFRQLGEDDTAYRLRISTLDDVVSPAAIRRVVQRILSPLGLTYTIREVRKDLGLAWDWFAWDHGDACDDGMVFAPRSRFFLICVNYEGLGEWGFAWSVDPADEAVGAWDHDFFDGYAVTFWSAVSALYAAVEAARAAGVAWILMIDYT